MTTPRSRLVQRLDERQDYETPPDFFAKMEKEFGPFDVDVCAVSSTAKVARFFSPETDGLAQRWAPLKCWMNPPYGREIAAWITKARKEALDGARVVCLLPARTDAAWWQDNIEDERTGRYPWVKEVRFVRGRVRFWIDGKPAINKDGRPSGGKFPSAVVLLDGR